MGDDLRNESEERLAHERGEALYDASIEVLTAAEKYIELYNAVTGQGAGVVWLTDVDGRLFVMTRGEYRDVILENIDRIDKKPMGLFVRRGNDE